MVIVSEAEAIQRLTLDAAYVAVKQALIAAADDSGAVNPVVIGEGFNAGEVFAIKSGIAKRERLVGLKIGSYWPRNTAAGLAPHGSCVVLLDPQTGRPATVIEANGLNGLRTAAADAVAAHVLACADAHTLTLIGAGNQAYHEARALCSILPIRRVLITSRSTSRATDLQNRIASELKMSTQVVPVEYGCREADVLVTVTPSRAPLFADEWLKPGVHVASMGSDQAGKQELPVTLLHRARLFCDLPSQSLSIGEFQHVRAQVQSGEVELTAIGSVLAGRAAGRRSADEITVFDSSGIALQDLFVAASVTSGGLD